MDPKKCANLEDCRKIDMVLDKDMLSWQYADSIRAVCGKCKEGVQNATGNSKISLI